MAAEKYKTFQELKEIYGWSISYFYKNAKTFEPALLKIAGRAPKPHKFDIDILKTIISADGTNESKRAEKPSRSVSKRNRMKPEPGSDGGDDDLCL